MRQSSKHQYPDSFNSLSDESSTGHISHDEIDMDPHDRAVRRSAGRHVRKEKSSAPLWIICLLLFVGLIGFFLIRIPAKLKAASNTSSVELVIDDDLTADLSDDGSGELPDPDAELLTDEDMMEDDMSEEADLLIVEPTPEPEPSVHIHSYHNGICSECGAKPEFLTGFLPDEFYQESEHPGTVSEHRYEITAYANHGIGTYDKVFNIYLPYGYDESRPYNVLVLIHGGGGDENSWLNTVYDYGERKMCGRVIFDNMFEKGLCEPCIIVTPVTETNLCQGLTAGIIQMRDELRDYILPYVAEHYSTYAADGSLESLQAARDHFGLGGLSNGALFVFEGGMRYNFDLFGSYAAFSGNGEPWQTVGIIQHEPYADLPINCLFTGAGTPSDWQQNYTEIGYQYFLENEPRVVEGKNAWHVDVEGEHEWKVWFTDIYNALPLMFQTVD